MVKSGITKGREKKKKWITRARRMVGSCEIARRQKRRRKQMTSAGEIIEIFRSCRIARGRKRGKK